MSHFKSILLRTFVLTVLSLTAITPALRAQKATPAKSQEQTDDIIRVNTELVQTEVMVFDRQNRFVDGLKPEQFELTLNGTKQAVSFFERVKAGSSTEAAQLAAARRSTSTKTEPVKATEAGATDRGRVIFFFLDDAHLSGASLARAREALRHFVNNQMNPNDQVAIVSTSGQIGFLQQLTDNPTVLREAISRLNYKRNPEAYTGKTQISEFMASQVEDYANRELFAYLMESTKMEQQMGTAKRGDHKLASTYSASPLLRNRLRQINAQSRMTTADTLQTLQSLMLSSAALPGRKVVFFLSDGFIINERKAGALEHLRRVTETATRAGCVVYTIDLRGTYFGFGSGADASTNDFVEMTGRKAGLLFGEISATQEPLKIIADETGGRAILSSNAPGEAILQAIQETSDYYVLAWRPDSSEQREGKLRLQVTIKDRPELRVRLRSTFQPLPRTIDAKTNQTDEGKGQAGAPSQSSDAQLLTALGSLYPQRTLPVSLSTGYLQLTDPVLKISMQIESEAFRRDPDGKVQKAEVDVIGAAIDDRGIIVTFKQVLTVPDSISQDARLPVVWNQQLNVKPGLYQVRVAVRERGSGRTGSAQQWIEVPDPARKGFGLSSLFLGERKHEAASGAKAAASPQAITVDVDHRFARTSVLRFQTYVYNAARGANGAAVWIQAQVFRNRQQVMSVAPSKVPLTADPARLPYWTEIPLNQLPAGQYTLQVSATDEIGKANATQRINFSVE